jgi:hypothetical protein
MKPQEKLELLIKKRAELDAQLRAVQAQERQAERKRDTRRKVVAGAIALEQLERNPNRSFATELRALLDSFVEPRSRDLFAFLPAAKLQSVEANADSGASEHAVRAA